MSTFGESLQASMNQYVQDLLDRCEKIITSKCTERASNGFGRCRFDWSIEFAGINLAHDDIRKIVEGLGGLTVEWFDPKIGFSVRWICDSDITEIREHCKENTISNPELPSIDSTEEEKKEEVSTVEEMKQD